MAIPFDCTKPRHEGVVRSKALPNSDTEKYDQVAAYVLGDVPLMSIATSLLVHLTFQVITILFTSYRMLLK